MLSLVHTRSFWSFKPDLSLVIWVIKVRQKKPKDKEACGRVVKASDS